MEADPERDFGAKRMSTDDDRKAVGAKLVTRSRDRRCDACGKRGIPRWLVGKRREIFAKIEADDVVAVARKPPRQHLVRFPKTDVVPEKNDDGAGAFGGSGRIKEQIRPPKRR